MKTILACFLCLTASARADSLALGYTRDTVMTHKVTEPQELVVTFGGRMDVYVDGDKLATEELAGRRAPREKIYELGAEQLKGKSTVKFQAPPDARGGSVFGVRIMKPAGTTPTTGT